MIGAVAAKFLRFFLIRSASTGVNTDHAIDEIQQRTSQANLRRDNEASAQKQVN